MHHLAPMSKMQNKLYKISSSFTLDTLKFVGYIDDLMDAVAAACQQTSVPHTPDITANESPDLCADLDRPDKQKADAQHRVVFPNRFIWGPAKPR